MSIEKDPHRYDDMLDMPHHTSTKHPRMSARNRAAQFAPFAALTGYDAMVKETARVTQEEAELTEDEISELDISLQFLQAHIEERPTVEIEYFIPDERKSGGSYKTNVGKIKKIDTYKRQVIFFDEAENCNGNTIPIDRIVSIRSDFLPESHEY